MTAVSFLAWGNGRRPVTLTTKPTPYTTKLFSKLSAGRRNGSWVRFVSQAFMFLKNTAKTCVLACATTCHAKNNTADITIQLQDRGSGRKTPTKLHGTGACQGVFIPESTCTKDGIILPAILLLAWVGHRGLAGVEYNLIMNDHIDHSSSEFNPNF